MNVLNFRPDRITKQGFTIIGLLILSPLLAQASTYYTSKGGNDSNSCSSAQSQSSPKLTVAAGIGCLRSGDTLIIGDGTYAETIVGTIPDGTASAPTTVRAANRNMAILAPTSAPMGYVIRFSGNSNIVVDGVVADAARLTSAAAYGFFPDPSSNIVLQNGTAKNGKGTYGSGIDGIPMDSRIVNMDILDNGSHENLAHGIYLSGSRNIIDGNRISNSGAYGIVLYSGSVSVDNNTVKNNRVFNNTDRGVGTFSGSGNVFYNNILYNNGRGIELVGGSDNHAFNNTIYGVSSGNCIQISDSRSRVQNNICYKNQTNAIVNDGVSSTISNNLFQDPSFSDEGSRDFTLLSTSAAIDAGVAIPEVQVDFLSTGRPTNGAYDIGAFEYTTTARPAGPTNLRVVSQ